MKNLANSMEILAGQLNRLEQVPKSDELDATINEFPGMMGFYLEVAQKLDAYV